MLYLNRKSLFIGTTLLLFATGAAMAAQTQPTGTWSGVARNEKSDRIRVEASFDKKAAHLHFGEPRNCKIEASYIETDADGSDYAFKPTTNGGDFCQKLYPGNLIATSTDNGVTLSLTQGNSHWHAELKPDSP
jgi:hypothetical protein